ncbi:MAG: hypothetical protein WC284_08720 [Candidimonas sp.]
MIDLMEKFMATIDVVTATGVSSVPVFVNPSPYEVNTLFAKSKHLRGLIAENQLYVWDAYHLNHVDVINNMAINGSKIELYLYPDYVELGTLNLPAKQLYELEEKIKNFSPLIRIYGHNFSINHPFNN